MMIVPSFIMFLQRSHPTSSESSDGAETEEEKAKKRKKKEKKHKKHKLRESDSEVCTCSLLICGSYSEMYGILIGTGQ